jgi:hypothetical protein
MRLTEKILSRCLPDGDCLVWQGCRVKGYGRIRIGKKSTPVHRVIYQEANGEIPLGLEIDHVKARGCRSRACCNLAHLELVTRRENSLRSDSPPGVCARKTTCRVGHPLSGDNLVAYRAAQGERLCRKCWNESNRTAWRRRAAALQEASA